MKTWIIGNIFFPFTNQHYCSQNIWVGSSFKIYGQLLSKGGNISLYRNLTEMFIFQTRVKESTFRPWWDII